MLTRRNWLLRLSVVLNVAVLFYFGSYLTIRYVERCTRINPSSMSGGVSRLLRENRSFVSARDRENAFYYKILWPAFRRVVYALVHYAVTICYDAYVVVVVVVLRRGRVYFSIETVTGSSRIT